MTVEGALHAPSTVRALLDRFGLRADKGFGQNFLVDFHALNSIVESAELRPEDTVLEVGPGLGVLTKELVSRAGKVVSVELDSRMFEVLEQTVGNAGNLELRHGDAMQFDFLELPDGSVLVANLPYNIASGLIARALESGTFRRLAVMVQREVAERLVATPGAEGFGSLSLLVEYYAEARIIRNVPPSSFYPPPEVTSSIVRLESRPGVVPQPELFSLIRHGFRHRRKTLSKNLQMAGFSRASVVEALTDEGHDLRVRGEELGLEEFQGLLRRLRTGA